MKDEPKEETPWSSFVRQHSLDIFEESAFADYLKMFGIDLKTADLITLERHFKDWRREFGK